MIEEIEKVKNECLKNVNKLETISTSQIKELQLQLKK
jgi:hypothetical protein